MTRLQNLQCSYCRPPLFKGFLISFICFLLLAAPAFSQGSIGQEEWYYAPNENKGSWKVTTDVYSRKTRIEFFGLDDKLIFKKELHGKWLKLTRKNRKILDAFLMQILPNGQLTDRLSTKDFLNPPGSVSKRDKFTQVGEAAPKYEASVHINQQDKIYIAIENKLNLPYIIALYGRNGQQLYKEHNNLSVYRRTIDVSMVYERTYKVVITMDHKQHIYYLSRSNRNTSTQKITLDAVLTKINNGSVLT